MFFSHLKLHGFWHVSKPKRWQNYGFGETLRMTGRAAML